MADQERDKKDAERWRMLMKIIRDGRAPGPAHGRLVRLLELDPVRGDYGDVKDIEQLVDACIYVTKVEGRISFLTQQG